MAVFGGAWRIRERIVEAGGRSVAQDFRAYCNLFLRLYQMSTAPNDPFISVDHDLQSLLLQVGWTLNPFCLAWMGCRSITASSSLVHVVVV